MAKDKAYCLKHQAGNARDYFKKHHTDIKFEPVGTTKDGKSFCFTAGYANGSGENIGNYAVHTLEKGCKSMAAEPVNVTVDGFAHTIKAGYAKQGMANFITNGGHSATGVAEPVRVGCMPSPDGELKNSQAFRVYSTDGKSVNLTSGGGGAGGKTGLYAIQVDDREPRCYATPCEWDEDGRPIKAVSCADGKVYTVYEVKDGKITIKGKEYPIKLVDGYYIIRKLTVRECMRLQTVGGGYAERRYAKFFEKKWQLRCIKCVGKGTPEHLKGGSK